MAMTKCHRVTSIVFGVLEILLAVALVIVSFIFSKETNIKTVFTPYWVGFPYLLPAILMIIAGAAKNQGCMVATMVFNILLTIASCIPAVILTIAWATAEFGYSCVETTDGNTKISSCEDWTPIVAAIAIVSYVCAALAFASSILGCAATCCSPSEPQQVVILAQPQPGLFVSSNTTSGLSLGAYGQEGFEGYMPTHDKSSLVV